MAYGSGLLDQTGVDPNSPDYATQIAALARRRKLVDALSSAPMPQAQMVSGHYVAPGWAGALGEIAQALIGRRQRDSLDTEENRLGTQHRTAIRDWIGNMPQSRDAVPAQPGMDALTPNGEGGSPDMPAQPGRAAQPAYTPSRTEMMQWALSGPDQPGEIGKTLSASVLANALKGGEFASGTRFNPQTGTLEHGVWDKNSGQWVMSHGVPEFKSSETSGFDAQGNPTRQLRTPTGQVVADLGTGRTTEARKTSDLASMFGVDPKVAAQVGYGMIQNPVAIGPGQSPVSPNVGAAAGLPIPGYNAPQAAPAPAPMAPQPIPAGPSQQPSPPAADALPQGLYRSPGGAVLTENGPYAGKPLGPGYPADKRSPDNLTKLNEDTQAYGKELTAKNMANVAQAMKRMEDTYAKYPEGKLPGVGHLANLTGSQVFSKEGQDVQNTTQQLYTALLTIDAGKSQTINEVQNELKKMGLSVFQSEATARAALPKLRAAYDAIKKSIDDTYHPDVVRNYNSTKGSVPSAEEFADKIRARLGQGG